MPVHVAPVVEQDIPRLISIEFAAYANNPEAILLRGRDPNNPSHFDRATRRYIHMLSHDPNMTFLKAVDSTTDTILGWIRWDHYSSLDHSLDSAHDFDAWPVPGDEAMLRAYWASYELERREIMGTRPHIFLANLVVDPSFQRQGVAKVLLAHCLQAADKINLPTYLDSSPAGRRLYEAAGFIWVRDGVFDLSIYGRSGTRTHSIMLRDPASQDDSHPHSTLASPRVSPP